MPISNAKTTLLAVMLVTLVGTAGIALPYPVLAPLFLDGPANDLTHFMNMPPKLLLGIVLALFPLGLLLGSSIVGALSDQLGRRRTLLFTLLLAAAGYALSALALSAQNFLLFAAARFLTGLCEGNIAIARAMAADLHPTIDRTRALSLAMACSYAGWLLGPLSGGYLGVNGPETVFCGGAVAVIACATLAQILMPADTQRKSKGLALMTLVRSQNSLALWREPAIRAMALFNLLFCLGVNAFYEFYPFWLVEKFGYQSHQIAWNTVIVTGVMIATSALAIPTLKKRFGAQLVVYKGAVGLGVLLLLLPWVNAQGAFALFALIGVGISTVNGVFPAIMSERFEQYGQGRVMGLLTANFCLTSTAIALMGSGLALLGSQWTLMLGGLLCLAGAAWFAILHRASDDWPAKADAQ
ncbi:MFS transporter [Microbulbifer sp. CAU 1566]|uniref:MFS transporter n=1 Tax=Microbulbifer sp. CAU 1566 TaxID=2933269 RepID=UPI0020038551|nr:MFS transporter [Microbulbifer sp. CAU 1566]MCK7598536.1 MFS transporter [Microbulbifer sp. CAU 1566]